MQCAEHRGPPHKRAPVKGEAQKQLRPIGDALHKGVDHDQNQWRNAEQFREIIKLQQHNEAN